MLPFFRDYLFLVLGIACIGAVADSVLNTESPKNPGLIKTLRAVISLCVVGAVLSPFIGAVSGKIKTESLFPRIEEVSPSDYEGEYEKNIVAECKNELEKTLCEYIYLEFGINPKTVCIELKENEDSQEEAETKVREYHISSVFLTFEEVSDGFGETVEAFVKKALACENVKVGEA